MVFVFLFLTYFTLYDHWILQHRYLWGFDKSGFSGLMGIEARLEWI